MLPTSEDVSGVDSEILSQLSSGEGKALLDAIDNLRAIKVGELVNLPQIIVVGDQSSGKSSVLEAISRVRFPVDEDVCTRFATELVLRKANETRVNVSIQYAHDSDSPEHNDAESQPFRRSGFDKDVLPEIINEAKERMKIRKGEFSKDVLRVEIHGPDIESLTLVDLPGFFHSATSDQSKEGRQIAYELIEHYMRQDKSIILAVVAANYNYASQTVLEEVRKYDPTRQRTLGVVTKPDLAGHGPNCRKYIDLINGLEPEHDVLLGWFVLRNRSDEEKDLSCELRDLKEQVLFKSGEWSTVRHSSRGVENLRKKLSKVLLEHIRRCLPDLIHDIDDKLSEHKERLKRLGKDRSEVDDQRLYLLDIAERFNRLAHDAIEGRYSDAFFGTVRQDANKLRATLRKLNQAFAAILAKKGKAYEINFPNTNNKICAPKYGLDKESCSIDYLKPFVNKYNDFRKPESITTTDFKQKIDSLAARNLGRELPGIANSGLALQLFQVQMGPWRAIAQFHLDLTLGVSKAFVEQLFSYIIGLEKTTEMNILRECVDPFFSQKKEVLYEKLQELLRPHEEGYGLPLEARFHKAVSQSGINRLAGKLIEKENVIDMMETHYEMSLTTFTENVISLAVESCLVRDIPSILTPAAVFRMKTETLEKLAAQSEEVSEERAMLQARVKKLEEGLETCRRSRPREPSGLSTKYLAVMWTVLFSHNANKTTELPSIMDISASITGGDPEPSKLSDLCRCTTCG
ncbi:dynamin family protein [Thozetella sp. PMI_491]|nr:dynamin family protein [Thozetella sp. PMI_491]